MEADERTYCSFTFTWPLTIRWLRFRKFKMLSNVVLPQPSGPMMAIKHPGLTMPVTLFIYVCVIIQFNLNQYQNINVSLFSKMIPPFEDDRALKLANLPLMVASFELASWAVKFSQLIVMNCFRMDSTKSLLPFVILTFIILVISLK